MSEYLFIGGPADGRRVELAEPLTDMHVVPVIKDLRCPLGGDYNFDIDEPACERLEYWRNSFRVDGIDFVVYTCPGYGSSATVVRMLIDRYK